MPAPQEEGGLEVAAAIGGCIKADSARLTYSEIARRLINAALLISASTTLDVEPREAELEPYSFPVFQQNCR
jgi:hypothetical protein